MTVRDDAHAQQAPEPEPYEEEDEVVPDAWGVGDTQFSGMSLEDIFALPGVVTAVSANRIPVWVTTITAEDIRMTPARNIYDLIEVYVPGSTFLVHHEGPHVGIRGIVL